MVVGGGWLLGSGLSATEQGGGGGEMWHIKLFACFRAGAAHSDNTWPQCQRAALTLFLLVRRGQSKA